ncbi:hypothetical protein CBR_g50012 [Chara braunii]|uniref:OTU domain-containing protein n=1 Tax=Chara braunii TaxID=69332 RepID=A0A388K5A0_CHABU|nr:hypothetical protein CBR_g50012 [Chara braunii]|eukprot:GBG65221.1 hypothetical protein CBR_g50012 [Chara braunii]
MADDAVPTGGDEMDQSVQDGGDLGAASVPSSSLVECRVPAKLKETREEMLARHRREVKELQGKEIEMKKAAAKGSKAAQKAARKAIDEEIARLDAKMKKRHAAELVVLLGSDEHDLVGVADTNGMDVLVRAVAGVGLAPPASRAPTKMSRAQRWRATKATQEAEREQRIQEEQRSVLSSRELEDRQLEEKLRPLDFTLREIKPDGHCLYRAVEDQLSVYGPPKYDFMGLRALAAMYMRQHREDFMPFIGEQGDGNSTAEDLEVDAERKFEKYCDEVESTAAWGGQLELGALSHALRQHIMVFSADLPVVEMGKEYETGATDGKGGVRMGPPSLRVSYHRHAYGLGEHYNSVIPAVTPSGECDTYSA